MAQLSRLLVNVVAFIVVDQLVVKSKGGEVVLLVLMQIKPSILPAIDHYFYGSYLAEGRPT